jgi:hypothetical protein
MAELRSLGLAGQKTWDKTKGNQTLVLRQKKNFLYLYTNQTLVVLWTRCLVVFKEKTVVGSLLSVVSEASTSCLVVWRSPSEALRCLLSGEAQTPSSAIIRRSFNNLEILHCFTW